MLELNLRHKELQTDENGRARWAFVIEKERVDPRHVAVIVCDMWNKHWSRGATERVDTLARKMNTVLGIARRKGVHIIHAPSDTLDYYEGHPARERMEAIALDPIKEVENIKDVKLPVDDSDGGSDTNQDGTEKVNENVWSRQHPAIDIDGSVDCISDMGFEIYDYMKQKNIQRVLIMGVHTNMCVLGRSFGIKQMRRWGVNIALVRDLTDAMYNPAMPPYVSHEEGTRLIIEHIEAFYCPSVESLDLI